MWAQQFCRELPWTKAAAIPPVVGAARAKVVVRSATRSSIEAAVIAAAAQAGTGGEVIYSIGHGNAAAMGATAQLAPGADFTVTQEILAADATGTRVTVGGGARMTEHLSASDQAVNESFRAMGAAMVAAGVSQFTFLVCSLGSNSTFLSSIKAVWGGTIAVAGYRGFVATELQTDTDTRGRRSSKVALYLSSDPAGANVIGGTKAEPNTYLELPDARHVTVV